jgi:hypothetical protein
MALRRFECRGGSRSTPTPNFGSHRTDVKENSPRRARRTRRARNFSASWVTLKGRTKVRRYIRLFVASELVSDVLGFIPASSPCGLQSKAGGRTEVFTAEGAEYAESENQYSFVLFVSFVVKQSCAAARVLALYPLSLGTHPKRQRAERLNPRKDRREREGE